MPHRIFQSIQQAQESLQQIQARVQQLAGQGQQSGAFAGPQSIMQPGFAGTDAQQVRQDIQNSSSGQITSQQAGSMGMMGQQGGNFQSAGFSGPQSVMQPGFAGTNAQQVRQDIQNSSIGGNFGQQGGSLQGQGGNFQSAGFTGPQSVMQQGFAGTNAQQVRQDIQNSNIGGNFGQQGSSLQGQGGNFQSVGYAGPQSIMQPGFAGTNAQQVRQDIQNSIGGNFGQQGGSLQGQGGNFQSAGYAGPQSIMQPGFAGTDAQQVRQDIGNSINQGFVQ